MPRGWGQLRGFLVFSGKIKIQNKNRFCEGGGSGWKRTFASNQGAIILGHVKSSVISNEVLIEEDAIVDKCVVMEGSVIKRGAKIYNAILAPHTIVDAGVEINLKNEEVILVGGKVSK